MDHSAANRDTLVVSPLDFPKIHTAVAVEIVKIPGFLMPPHPFSAVRHEEAEKSWFDDEDEEYKSNIESSIAHSEEEDGLEEVKIETARAVEMLKVPKFLLPAPVNFRAKDPFLRLYNPTPQRATKLHEALVKKLEEKADNEDSWNSWYVSNISLEQGCRAKEANWSGYSEYTDWIVDRKHYPEAESIFDLEMNNKQFRNPFLEDREVEDDVEAFEFWIKVNEEGNLTGWDRSLSQEVAKNMALLGMLTRLEKHDVVSSMPWNAIYPTSGLSSEELDVADYFPGFDEEYFTAFKWLDDDFERSMSPTSIRSGKIPNPFISEFDDNSWPDSSSVSSSRADNSPTLSVMSKQSLIDAEGLLGWIDEHIFSEMAVEYFSSLDVEALVSDYQSAPVLENQDLKRRKNSFTFFDLSPHAPRMGCHCYHCQDGAFGRHAGLLDKISAHPFSEWCFCRQCEK